MYKVKVAQSCPTLCDLMDYTVHRILQARILEWVTFPSSRGSSQPRDRTQVSRFAGRFFTVSAIRTRYHFFALITELGTHLLPYVHWLTGWIPFISDASDKKLKIHKDLDRLQQLAEVKEMNLNEVSVKINTEL